MSLTVLNLNLNLNLAHIATSGYSYTEWTEFGFYPPETQPVQMLPLYAQHFLITELNTTWYQMPKAESLERLQAQVPRAFRFAVKLNRRLTHEIDTRLWPRHVQAFREGLAPLLQAKQLAAVLLSFPQEFTRSPSHRSYLAELLDALAGLPLAIEFRDASWAHERVYAELIHRKVTLTLSDRVVRHGVTPFPAQPRVTNPAFFYVRFHGRAPRRGSQRQPPSSINYDYSTLELQACAEHLIVPLAREAKEGFVFFCNYGRARAPHNARQLMDIMKEKSGLADPVRHIAGERRP